jgi:putative Mg2+ transporter-C (MgtC) family protein
MEAALASLYATELGIPVIIARMLWAIGLGAVIGFDREYLNRPAGLRTHIIVSLAAATFAILTLELFAQTQASQPDGPVSADPIRIIEAVTAGVAFLAAGSIIMSGGKVHGLTTGAGLWLAGAIGAACGIGVYPIAILATVFGFLALALLRLVADRLPTKDDEPGAD